MYPNELDSKPLVLATDKMRSFMLRKNLYQYLTGCKNLYLFKNNDAASYDFNQPIFQSWQGRALTIVINYLVKHDPKDRMSVRHALIHLNTIISQSANPTSTPAPRSTSLRNPFFVKSKKTAINKKPFVLSEVPTDNLAL